MKKTVIMLAIASMFGLSSLAQAHGDDPAAKHGGMVSIVKDVTYELVSTPDSLTMYVEDHGKAVDTKQAKAKVTMLIAGKKVQADLIPAGENKLQAKGKFDVNADTKIISVVTLPGKSASTVNFALKEEANHEHGEHAHGNDAHEASYGMAGDPKKVTRTIKIGMNDSMRFTQDNITIKQGETVKFVVSNQGKILHEMVIGTIKDLQEHAEMMKKMPNMQHNDPNMVRVMPNKSGEIVWTFNQAGSFDFACLQPGHSEAGMKGKVTVVADSSQPVAKPTDGHDHQHSI